MTTNSNKKKINTLSSESENENESKRVSRIPKHLKDFDTGAGPTTRNR